VAGGQRPPPAPSRPGADDLVKTRGLVLIAATAGPMTSATAASTTAGRRPTTSHLWCSTPRCTPTPAANGRQGDASWAPWSKFASGGQGHRQEGLWLMAMTYGHVYVASVAMGASQGADPAWPSWRRSRIRGRSLILPIHCIAHGIDMAQGRRSSSGPWTRGAGCSSRHDPRRSERGENPLQLDCPEPKTGHGRTMAGENGFPPAWLIAMPDQPVALTRRPRSEASSAVHQYAATRRRPGGCQQGSPPLRPRPRYHLSGPALSSRWWSAPPRRLSA